MAQVEDVNEGSTSEIVELDRLRVSRPWDDIRASFENGKAEHKAPWDAV